MKATRISLICVLCVAAVILAFMNVKSVTTPIKFDSTRESREVAIKQHLIDLRAAQEQYRHVHKKYTDNPDTLIAFLQNTPLKSVSKEGSLGDKQLELLKSSGEQAERKVLNIFADAEKRVRNNKKLKDKDFSNDSVLYSEIWKDSEVLKYGLDSMRFRRDTMFVNMIDSLYHGRYDQESIKDLVIIPYSKGDTIQFAIGEYYSKQGPTPLFEMKAPYESYLWDLDKQELANLIDKEQGKELKRKDPKGEYGYKKSDFKVGLKVGDAEEPNGGHGNWE